MKHATVNKHWAQSERRE